MILKVDQKVLWVFFLIAAISLASSCGKNSDTNPPVNPPGATKKDILFADPCIIKQNGVYYLYGTSDDGPDNGIQVYKSTDLAKWEGPAGVRSGGYALSKGESYGSAGFWAPHVIEYNGKFYMYYTANERIAVAVSNSPVGPFTQTVTQALHPSIKEIDPHVFKDTDGKFYIYFVRLDNGNKIFVAELNSDLLSVKDATITECINYSQGWENTSGATWVVTEAPAVVKRNNLYYLFYSGNDFRSPDYSTGYATSTSPMGPWIKYAANPVLTKTNDVKGTGSAEFITNNAGELLMFYHQHKNNAAVTPRKVAYGKCEFVSQGTGVPEKVAVSSVRFYPQYE